MIRVEMTGLEAAGVMSMLVEASQHARRHGDETLHNLYVRVARKIRDAINETRIDDAEITS